MNSTQLVEYLNCLGNSLARKSDIESQLNVSEEEYIEHCLPTPKKKTPSHYDKPSKKSVIISLILCLISIAVCAVLLLNIISAYSIAGKINGVLDDEGTEYEAFLESYANAKSVDELKENWKPVEEAWKKRGVNVDWAYIENAAKNTLVNSADRFDSTLRNALHREWEEANTSAAFKVFPCLIIAILLIVFLVRFIKACTTLHEENQKVREIQYENTEKEQYNSVTLPALLKEREDKIPGVREKYAQIVAKLREELQGLEGLIAKLSPVLPQHYHPHALEIARIIEHGRADDVKEAINVFESDQQAERLERAEMRRAQAEQDAREREAARAKVAAKKAEFAQAAAAREDLRKRKQAASDRCAHCAYRTSCSFSVKSRFFDSGDICPSYVPK